MQCGRTDLLQYQHRDCSAVRSHLFAAVSTPRLQCSAVALICCSINTETAVQCGRTYLRQYQHRYETSSCKEIHLGALFIENSIAVSDGLLVHSKHSEGNMCMLHSHNDFSTDHPAYFIIVQYIRVQECDE